MLCCVKTYGYRSVAGHVCGEGEGDYVMKDYVGSNYGWSVFRMVSKILLGYIVSLWLRWLLELACVWI